MLLGDNNLLITLWNLSPDEVEAERQEEIGRHTEVAHPQDLSYLPI